MKKLWGTLALTIVLAATLFGYDVNADGTTASNCTGAGGQSQLGQYCGSSQSSQQGSNAASSLWKVWGGVSVVCIHACIAGGAGPAGAAACKLDTEAGATTQGVVTKNYSSGLTTIAQAQGGSALSKVEGSKPDSSADSTDGTSEKDQTKADQAAKDKKNKQAKNAACAGAATAVQKAISNYQTMKGSSQAAAQTTKAAASLDSSAAEASGGVTTGGSPSSMGSGPGSVQGSGRMAGMSAAMASSGGAICASARQTSIPSETLQCAVSSDPSLPAMVTSGLLPKAFTQASGTAFSNFGNSDGQSPADAIAQAASGTLSASDGLKVTALLKGMEGDLMANQGAMYTSGGGSGSSGTSDESSNAAAQAQLQDQLKEMLAKSQGDQPQEEAPTGVSAVIFANQNRSPSAIPQDTSLSIFDRVTYRYYFVVKQLRVENFQ